jgi:hypothetical protein
MCAWVFRFIVSEVHNTIVARNQLNVHFQGMARELVNRIQKLRKTSGCVVGDQVPIPTPSLPFPPLPSLPFPSNSIHLAFYKTTIPSHSTTSKQNNILLHQRKYDTVVFGLHTIFLPHSTTQHNLMHLSSAYATPDRCLLRYARV